MRKKITLYPKTKRIGNPTFQITEKLDGANLGFFKLDGDLLIAQRNNAFLLSELKNNKDILYKGLYDFLIKNGEDLVSRFHESSGVFGEWIGMSAIKYQEALDKKFYIFAKANLEVEYLDSYSVTNIYWKRELLQYPFITAEIPEYFELTPLVAISETVSIEYLDKLYDEYVDKVGRSVEGFVIMNESGTITKYVRHKRGKIGPHEF